MNIDILRRRLVLGSAALAAQFSFQPAALAQLLKQGATPTVDTLTVKVLTDSSYDTPRAGTSKWVRIKRAPTGSPTDFRKTLHNEWGLSLALESRIGADTRNVMLDFGWTPNALLNNMELVGVDGKKIQALIVSHGHFDHYGGLLGFLQKYRGMLADDLTLYAGGEDNFCQRMSAGGTPGSFVERGMLDRRDLAALKVRVVLCEQPTVVMGHAFTTGTIQRRSFEQVIPSAQIVYGAKDGAGCSMPTHEAKTQGKPAKDEHWNEHATCFNVKDRGLVVITSCGHAGVINSVRQAMEVSGISKVHAVLGGMHLFAAEDDYLRRTVTELKAINPDVVIPFHCSGPNFTAAVREQMPERLITSTTGTEFVFGA